MAPEWKPLTDDQILAQLPAAREAARAADAREPHALSARYDAEANRVVLELSDGCAYAFPPSRDPELAALSPAELARVALRPGGRGLFWEGTPAEVSVPALLGAAYPVRAGRGTMRVAEPPRAPYGPAAPEGEQGK